LISDNASMQGEDFSAQYRALSDEALTQLASEGGLRPEADDALRAEMRKRSIGSKDVRSLRVKQKKAKLQTWVGNNPYSYKGTGLRLRGDKFLTESDRNKGITVVTRWVVFIFMPLIPLGSYRVKYPVDGNSKLEIIGRVSLQWDQVIAGWKTALFVLLAIIGVILASMWWTAEHN
jgi:hypothetical protein